MEEFEIDGLRLDVAVNAEQHPVAIRFPIQTSGQTDIDRLNHGDTFQIQQGQLSIELPACWGRVLKIQG